MNTRLIFLPVLLCFVALKSAVQIPQRITFNLKNNGVLPREFKFLERHPDSRYPNVFTAYILPGQLYTVKLKVGTVLSQVNQQEINATMRGQEAPGKLLLIVKPQDENRLVQLIPQKR